MRALLINPKPEAVQFGLAPFFQTEPLGLEYLAAAAHATGQEIRIADMRFERASLRTILSKAAPRIVGINPETGQDPCTDLEVDGPASLCR